MNYADKIQKRIALETGKTIPLPIIKTVLKHDRYVFKSITSIDKTKVLSKCKTSK